MNQRFIIAIMCTASLIGAMENGVPAQNESEKSTTEKPGRIHPQQKAATAELTIQVQQARITAPKIFVVASDTREYLDFKAYSADIKDYVEAKTVNPYQQSAHFIELLRAGLREKAQDFEHGKLWQCNPKIGSYRDECILQMYFHPLSEGDAEHVTAMHAHVKKVIEKPSFATRHTLSKLTVGLGLFISGAVFAASILDPIKTPHTMTRWDFLHTGRAIATICCGFFALASGWNEQYRIQQRVNNQFFQLLALLHTNRENADALRAEQQRNTLEI